MRVTVKIPSTHYNEFIKSEQYLEYSDLQKTQFEKGYKDCISRHMSCESGYYSHMDEFTPDIPFHERYGWIEAHTEIERFYKTNPYGVYLHDSRPNRLDKYDKKILRLHK